MENFQDSQAGYKLDATKPQKGKRFSPQEMKAARSFYKYCDDVLRMHTLASMAVHLPEKERKQWDRRLAKREYIPLSELPETTKQAWAIHQFLSARFLEWIKIVEEK